MRFGVLASILLHVAVIGAAFLSLPASWRPNFESEPYIPLELISQAELDLKTSVPAAAPEPKPEEEVKPDLPEPEAEEEAPAEEAAPEPEPEPVVEKAPEPLKTEDKPEEKPEPKEPPKVKPKKKPAELDFDALSKLVDKERDKERAVAPSETPSETVAEADQAHRAIGAGDRLTASDKAKMRAAVERCWNAGAIIGAPNPEKLIVVIDIELNRDGSLSAPPKVANAMEINLSGNKFWKVAEQQALRAVVSCAPYNIFGTERYDDWKAFRLNFDPSEMAGAT